MILFKRYKIRTYEMGLVFRDGEFRGLRTAGTHWDFDPLNKLKVEIVSQRGADFKKLELPARDADQLALPGSG